MIICTVHEPGRPSKSVETRSDELVFVKEGIDWLGLIFGPLWLLSQALWFEFAVAVLLWAGLSAGLAYLGLGEAAPGTATLLVNLLIGFEGNDLKRWSLERKGYRFLAIVSGRGFEECRGRFFDTWLPSLATVVTTNPSVKPVVGNPSTWGDWPGPGAIGTVGGEAV